MRGCGDRSLPRAGHPAPGLDPVAGPGPVPQPAGPRNTRFFGVAQINPERYARDLTRLSQEIIQHLASPDGVELEIRVEIAARKPDEATSQMPVEKTERDITTLMGEISRQEIKLPEIQRGYIWKPTQVAKLIESLYRGYPTGSLLFWKTTEAPRTRGFAADGGSAEPVVQPLYLLDGQQRLTALHRVLNNDPDAQVVFNVESEAFQNQSAATARDPRWVKVHDVASPGARIFDMVGKLHGVIGTLEPDEIARRLQRLAGIRDVRYHMEVLTNFPYEEVTQIFVRVNSGGRALRTSDLALATLSARWPGVLGKLEDEAAHWTAQGYGGVDVPFLTRALAGAVLGRGLSAWSHARLAAATDEELESGWHAVRRGLSHLVPLLKNNLKVSHSSLLPSLIVLLPLIVLLGERPDEPMDSETANGILYWLLVATIRNRYSGATDTLLGQDIPAARTADPVRSLLTNLGIVGTRVEVTARDLVGRSVNSPYFLLSFLVAQKREAHDWWFGSAIAMGGKGGQRLEYHHVHPQATLTGHANGYSKAEINDIANLAFISAKANRKIADQSPVKYFASLHAGELTAHLVPADETVRDASAYREFLAARRRLLAAAMTELLDGFRPQWLDQAATADADPLSGSTVEFTIYESQWDASRLVITAQHHDVRWAAAIALSDLESALAGASDGLDSDIEIGGQDTPVKLDSDDAQIPLGPFLVTGTVEAWHKTLEREHAESLPLSQLPVIETQPYQGELILFPVTNVE